MKILLILFRLIFFPIKLLSDLIYGPTKPNLVAYAWYDKNQYQKFLDSSKDDIAELVPTFDGWLKKAEENIENYKNKGWIIARFSGTEPLLRVFSEMPDEEQAEKACEVMKEFLGV